MIEFLHFAFSPPNLIATFLMCLIFLYWLIVIVGIIDMDSIDFDVDVDTEVMVEVDVDIDADTDTTGNAESSVSWLSKALIFFNLGKIPFMVWFSMVVFPLWIGTIVVNFILLNDSFLIGLVLFIPLAIGAIIISKPLTYPFVKIFKVFEKDNELKSLLGKVGIVKIPGTEGGKGQIEINYNGSHILVYVKPLNKSTILFKNQKVLVIEKENEQVYLVEPYEE